MNRTLFIFCFVLVCLACLLSANPLPQDAQQGGSNELDNIASRAKEIWGNATETIGKKVQEWMHNPDVNDALEKTKTFFNQAGESIRKEVEKIGDKFNDQSAN